MLCPFESSLVMANIATKLIAHNRFERALEEKYEDTDRQNEQHRLPEQDTWKESKKRIGKGMFHTELLRYVGNSNHRIFMETSNANQDIAGFYWMRRDVKTFLVAFPKGFMSEWSIVETDRADLPVKERRGWRTVLVRLMKARALTRAQVMEIVRSHFGYSPAEWNKYWHLHTKDINN